jgi:hypothetical protein
MVASGDEALGVRRGGIVCAPCEWQARDQGHEDYDEARVE